MLFNMNTFNKLEQFVSEGYFSSENFKSEVISRNHFDPKRDTLIFINTSGPTTAGITQETKWTDYIKDYLEDISQKHYAGIMRRSDLTKEILFHEADRIRSLLSYTNSEQLDSAAYSVVLNNLIQKIDSYRHLRYGLEKNEQEKRDKIQTNLNVSQLAYLFRIMKEIAFQNNQPVKEYFELIQSTFSSVGADNITFASLKNKSLPKNVKDVEAVHSILVKLMNKSVVDKNKIDK